MAGKQSKPVTGILTGSLLFGNRSAIFPKPQSPKGPNTFNLGAVGLGIVAALEKTREIPANKALFNRSFSRSDPFPVKNSSRNRGSSDEMETESFEEYTIVTSHGPNESYTKVYGDGRKGDDRSPFKIHRSNTPSVFHISPVRITEFAAVPAPDFLSFCDLCQKKLHDKDIYMYRGEKAFCSTECRYKQIVIDERTEKCSSEASIRPVEVTAGSPYTNGQIFPTGILAI